MVILPHAVGVAPPAGAGKAERTRRPAQEEVLRQDLAVHFAGGGRTGRFVIDDSPFVLALASAREGFQGLDRATQKRMISHHGIDAVLPGPLRRRLDQH